MDVLVVDLPPGTGTVHQQLVSQIPLTGAPLVCPHCAESIEVFHPVREDRSIWTRGVPRLGRVPLHPEVSRTGDAGRPLVVARPDSPEAWAFRGVANELAIALEGEEERRR